MKEEQERLFRESLKELALAVSQQYKGVDQDRLGAILGEELEQAVARPDVPKKQLVQETMRRLERRVNAELRS